MGKKIINYLILFALLGCKTKPKIYSFEQDLEPTMQYIPDVRWSEFSANLPEGSSVNCAYHVIDFDVDKKGDVTNLRMSYTSLEAMHQYSLEAAKHWKFKPQNRVSKGRLAFIFSNSNKTDMLLLDPSMPIGNYSPQKKENEGLEPIKRLHPRFPREALRMRDFTGGYAVVEFVVQRDGSVDQAKVVNAFPPGLFEKNSLYAIKQWKYKSIDTPKTQKVKLEYRIEGGNNCIF